MANIRREANATDNALGHEAERRSVTGMLDCMLDIQRKTGHDLGRIFSDTIRASVHAMRMAPLHRDAIAATGNVAEDDPETTQFFSDIRDRYKDCLPKLAQILAILVQEADAEPYEDLLGPLYMLVRSRWAGSAMGQFFTPEAVAVMMAQITAHDLADTVCERLRAAATAAGCSAQTSDAIIAYARGEGPEPDGISDVPAHYQPVVVGEPCVGSGTLILSIASQLPRRMIVDGMVQFDVTDLDPLCAQMAWLNCMLHGLTAVIRQGNTLTMNLHIVGLAPAERDTLWRHRTLKNVA